MGCCRNTLTPVGLPSASLQPCFHVCLPLTCLQLTRKVPGHPRGHTISVGASAYAATTSRSQDRSRQSRRLRLRRRRTNSGRSDLDRNPVMASFELNRCSGRSKVRNGSAFKLAVYYLGIPAANHAPFPMTRMRSTGLAQVFGGAGESLSLMRKSPFTSS